MERSGVKRSRHSVTTWSSTLPTPSHPGKVETEGSKCLTGSLTDRKRPRRVSSTCVNREPIGSETHILSFWLYVLPWTLMWGWIWTGDYTPGQRLTPKCFRKETCEEERGPLRRTPESLDGWWKVSRETLSLPFGPKCRSGPETIILLTSVDIQMVLEKIETDINGTGIRDFLDRRDVALRIQG